MRHTGRRLAALGLVLATAGCFDAHGLGDDGGTPPGDAGPLIVDCYAARFAPEGAPCAFTGTCEGTPVPCGPITTVTCEGGRLRTYSPICTRAVPRSCDEYFMWSARPGEPCLSSDFVGCTLESDGCCVRRIACEENRLVDETSCIGCPSPDACPDYAPPPPAFPPCSSSADCADGTACRAPSAPRVCGICFPGSRECEVDADCGPGRVCADRPAPCSCSGLPDTECALDCRTAESDPCAEGERCAGDGHCRAISCSEGWECAPNTRCTPGADVETDVHGCSRLACADASECDCGVCIDGRCEDGPGVCMPPVP